METIIKNQDSPLYKNFELYKQANKLVVAIYRVTKKFPKDELFGLVSQMRRAAVSVIANFVEGYGRRTAKDKIQFLYIARGSLRELEYYVELSYELGYIHRDEYLGLLAIKDTVGKLLTGFTKSLEK